MAVLAVRFSNPTLFYADQQANAAVDVLRQAQQKAITQKQTMRVEINKDNRTIRIIDEKTSGDDTDDIVVLTKRLSNETRVNFDTAPTNLDATPDEPTPVPTITFKASLHPLSQGQNVATLRFLKNGNVVNDGLNSVGDGSTLTGATVYFWTPLEVSPTKATLVRAITILGTSGSTRYWKCAVVNGKCTDWVK